MNDPMHPDHIVLRGLILYSPCAQKEITVRDVELTDNATHDADTGFGNSHITVTFFCEHCNGLHEFTLTEFSL